MGNLFQRERGEEISRADRDWEARRGGFPRRTGGWHNVTSSFAVAVAAANVSVIDDGGECACSAKAGDCEPGRVIGKAGADEEDAAGVAAAGVVVVAVDVAVVAVDGEDDCSSTTCY